MANMVYIQAGCMESLASMTIRDIGDRDPFNVLIEEVKKSKDIDISGWDYFIVTEDDPTFTKFKLSERDLRWYGSYCYEMPDHSSLQPENQDAELY